MHVKKLVYTISITIMYLLLLPVVGGCWQIFPDLGEERVGTSSATFLKIGVGARAAAMGNSYVAVADDATCLYYNPAAMCLLKGDNIVFSHNRWFADIKHNFLGYFHSYDNLSLGVSFISLTTDDIEVTDEYHPYGTGDYFSYSDFAGGISFAYDMTAYFSFGITLKYIQENLDNLTAKGVLFDLGTYYRTGLGSTRFGVALLNFGNRIGPDGTYNLEVYGGGTVKSEYQKFSPPTVFQIGFAFEPIYNPHHRLTLSSQLNHPTDNAENISLGTEYAFNETVMLRGGYRINYSEEQYSLGAGTALNIGFTDLRVDYAFVNYSNLNNVNRFTFSMSF
ncbi:MAG: PorV/PorQ family protein [candidate division Zixibacteria bacterium]|nr:PorV/PorQ family protein [candidate division Zixibacteria bacterium]